MHTVLHSGYPLFGSIVQSVLLISPSHMQYQHYNTNFQDKWFTCMQKYSNVIQYFLFSSKLLYQTPQSIPSDQSASFFHSFFGIFAPFNHSLFIYHIHIIVIPESNSASSLRAPVNKAIKRFDFEALQREFVQSRVDLGTTGNSSNQVQCTSIVNLLICRSRLYCTSVLYCSQSIQASSRHNILASTVSVQYI